MNRGRILVIGVLCLVVLLPLFWWLCLPPRSAGDLHYARAEHGAVLLPSGDVLVIGGNYSYTPILDPDGAFVTLIGRRLGSWTDRLEFLWTGKSQSLSNCELFDPKTRRWTMAEPLHQPEDGDDTSPILLANGAVLECGESYEDGHWTKTGPVRSGIYENVLLSNGDVLGLADGYGPPLIYHSKDRTWTKAPDVPEGTLAALGDGSVLIASNDVCWIYEVNPKNTENPRPTGNLLLPKQWDFILVTLADGSALAIGGDYGPDLFKECEIFDSKTYTWKLTGSLNRARGRGDVAVRLLDARILVMGGCDSPYETSCELYNPGTGQWTETGSMLEWREYFTATVLADGQVLVTGGYKGRVDNRVYLASCELYNPKTGTWSRL